MIKDTEFYNKESAVYSEKRYPTVPISYTQFFFKERLRLTLKALKKYIGDKHNLSLLETGCADGIVLKEIKDSYGGHFSRLIGTDISSGMIQAAFQKFGNLGLDFKIRNEYIQTEHHDIVVEIGVINYAKLEDEFFDISQKLKDDGVAIISLAGTGSLWDRTRKSDAGFNTFLPYKDYEIAITRKFTILEIVPVGLPIPILWRIPSFARITTSITEKILRPLIPSLFHEKIYIIKPLPKNQG